MRSAPEAQKPRVLLLTQYLGIGGLERVILNLAKGLKASGRCEPVVFVYDEVPGAATLHDDFRQLGIEVIDFRKGPGFSMEAARAIARACRERGVKVIHSHDLSALIYAVIAKFLLWGRVRVVNTQHSFVHINNGPLYKYYEKVFTTLADKATAVSEGLRQQYATVGINPRKVELVPNGMDFPEKPLVDRGEALELREKLIAEVSDPKAAERLRERKDWTWLLCMARIHAGKGQDHVAELWDKIEGIENRRVALIYLGQETSPGELAKLLDKVSRGRAKENVIYAGFTKKPGNWRLASDIFVSGSEFEGMPLGPIESIGAGVDTFVSEIVGHSMLPSYVGRFSLEDKTQGAAELSKLIDRVSGDFAGSRREAWDKGRDTRETYGIAHMTRAYEKLYGI